MREAYTIAGEAALDRGSHSVIEGAAPAGRTLRIRKDISYRTSERPDDNGVRYPAQTITEPRESTLVVPGNGRFVWHVNPSGQPRAATQAAWSLTYEDGAGNVLGNHAVHVDRSQTIDIGTLACGDASSPANSQPATHEPTTPQPRTTACGPANGFRSVRVSRRGGGLRISFRRRTRNPVTVDIFRTSKGRTIVHLKRVARFRNRKRAFIWNGRKTSGKRGRVAPGVYLVRFRVIDDRRRIDSRRIVVEKRKSGRFVKRGKFLLESICP